MTLPYKYSQKITNRNTIYMYFIKISVNGYMNICFSPDV